MIIVKPKNDARLTVRLPSEVLGVLVKIEQRHKLAPQDVLRALAEEAAALFNEQGDFHFPVHIVPGERPAARRRQSGAAA